MSLSAERSQSEPAPGHPVGERLKPSRHWTMRRAAMLHESFRVGIALKGLHALAETVGGTVLLEVSPRTLNRILMSIVTQDLSQDPKDFIARHLRLAFEHFAAHGKHFASWYLLSHGGVKLVLVIALLRNKLWAYPWMLALLAAFIGYQTYRFSLTHSIAMILLTAFDIAVIVLTWIEYQTQISRLGNQQ